MSVCDRLNLKFGKNKYIEKYINTKVDIDQSIPFGFASSIDKDGKEYVYTYGKRDIELDLPFEKDSIYRMASQSKFMGTVGFLKLVDKGIINWDTPIKEYLPEYAKENMGVIKPIETPRSIKTRMNPIVTTSGSNIIHIIHQNTFQNGQYISLEWSNGSLDIADSKLPDVGGINGFEVFNIHKILNVTSEGYDIILYSSSTRSEVTGGFVKIRPVDKDTHRSITFSPDKMLINPKLTTHYYKLEPLKREITILDILNHGLGWTYYAYSALYMSFGYASDTVKRDIQAGIWNESNLPVGVPLGYYTGDITDWAKSASRIPLLYQPGEDWSYGPQLSLLGTIIQIVDGRDVETYMRDEIWSPLGMNDTGFFIYDEDPLYQNKKHRVCQLYVNMPKIVMNFIGDDIPYPAIYEVPNCICEGMRKLTFMDSGMFTTVTDYLKFMKMFLDNNGSILSPTMINTISTYRTQYDVDNLSTVDGYSSSLSMGSGISSNTKTFLESMKWGIGVGTMEGCKTFGGDKDKNLNTITWAGVLGTRFLIDFCAGVGFNVGTNVIGPPAGSFDSELINLIYKPMSCNNYKSLVGHII